MNVQYSLMKRQEAFNFMFDQGMNYVAYCNRSDQHQQRMELSFDATTEYIDSLAGEKLQQANHAMKILCIAENWCGDCGNGVPVIAKLAEVMTNWDFRIAARDSYEELVSQYYTTAGRKKIPVIVFADDDGAEVSRWVERPTSSYLRLNELREKRLPKEEYIQAYRENPVFRPPEVSHNIVNEILDTSIKSAALLRILPQKRGENQKD